MLRSFAQSALNRRRELPALARKLAWQSIPPGQMFFRAILLIIAGSMIVAVSEEGSKLELFGYFLFLMAANQTIVNSVWRAIDSVYATIARQMGWQEKASDEQND